MIKHPDHADPIEEPDLDDPSGRLNAYTARTQTPLDLLALLTLWIVLVPPSDFGTGSYTSSIVLIARIGLSDVYGVDIAIRTALATRHWHYLRTHWLSVFVVLIPSLRLVLSLRLVRSLFRRGHLERFLLAASVLVLNGAIVVYFFEREARGSNIHTLGQSVWWAVTTVTTVGYGDYAPVTVGGRIAACLIMATGILTLAVITAQVASNFLDQGMRTRTAINPRSRRRLPGLTGRHRSTPRPDRGAAGPPGFASGMTDGVDAEALVRTPEIADAQ
jgi:voltage-gated potassium channel